MRAWQAAKACELALIVGSEMRIEDGPKLVLLVENLSGYQRLCQLITQARWRAAKGEYRLLHEDFSAPLEGLLALWIADEASDAAQGQWLCSIFGERLWLAVELHRGADDRQRLVDLQALAASLGIAAVAAGDVHMHARGRRALQDCMTAIRHHCTVDEAGQRLFPNGERHLRSRPVLAEFYPPELLAETVRIAARCTFDLGQLRYQYPRELVPDGHTPTTWLRELTEQGMRWRWPQGIPQKSREQAEKELALIADLGYESYFLTVHDIVAFARRQSIL